MPTNTNITKQQTPKNHRLKTFFASLFGIIGVYLILLSVSVVWLNQTLTNTTVYVNTVTPLISQPAIQNFIAQKVTDQITSNNSVQDLASKLLPNVSLTAVQSAQLQQQVDSAIHQNVLQTIQSPSFVTIWKNANQTAHQALVQQLNNGNLGTLTINMSPTVNAVLAELKTTPLDAAVSQTNISPNDGVIKIQNKSLVNAHKYYEWFKEGTIVLVILAIIAIAASIFISVNHAKTARRILLFAGILLLLQGVMLEAPTVINLSGSDQVTQAAAKAFVEVLVKNLQILSFGLGALFVIAAIGSKVYVTIKHKRT